MQQLPPGEPYSGHCAICGYAGTFERGPARSIRESYSCPNCRFPLRWRDQASLIIDEFGDGQVLSLKQLVASGRLADVAIFEPALRGPFAAEFAELPKYTQSYFWPERPLGSVSEEGIRNEDLTRLTFNDDSFDLVVTSDVLEHVFDIDAALAEIERVLKPGGVHIFSVPTAFPLPEKTTARVAIEDRREVHLLPPIYHNAGDGTPCLVYHDFGIDLPDRIDRRSTRTRFVRRSGAIEPCYQNATLITRKDAVRRVVSAVAQGGRVSAATHNGAAPQSLGRGTMPSGGRHPPVQCSVCGSMKFIPFNGRPNARCANCHSVERHRLMWLMVDELGLFRDDLRVFHIAPEVPLGRRFAALLDDKYFACDFDPEKYKTILPKVHAIDLCKDLKSLEDDSFDVIIHSHVLQQLPCSVDGVFAELERILSPGGHHLACVPIRGDVTVEELSPDLSDKDRVEQFGQADRIRIFGRKSMRQLLGQFWGEGDHVLKPVDLLGPQILARNCIPEAAWTDLNSHSIFYNRASQVNVQRPKANEEKAVGSAIYQGALGGEPAAAVPSHASDQADHPTIATAEIVTGITTKNANRRRIDTASWILDTLVPVRSYPRLVDLGAGHCRFSILAAERGYSVTAVDSRIERVPDDIGGITFRQSDIRDFDLADFDTILILGLFYHLTVDDQIALLNACPRDSVAVIDTQLFVETLPGLGDFLGSRISPIYRNVLGRYDGAYFTEKDNPMASVGNEQSFFPTQESFTCMLNDTGFRQIMFVDPIYYSPAGGRRWCVAFK